MPYSRVHAYKWFKNGGLGRSIETNPLKGEIGDVMFLGEPGNMQGHAILVDFVTKNKAGSISVNTLGQFGGPGNNAVGKRTFTLNKSSNGGWVAGNGQKFRGYGQIKKKKKE